jgi:hypothetical protein
MINFNGRVCYRHSALQALIHIPRFGNWLTAHDQDECKQIPTSSPIEPC